MNVLLIKISANEKNRFVGLVVDQRRCTVSGDKIKKHHHGCPLGSPVATPTVLSPTLRRQVPEVFPPPQAEENPPPTVLVESEEPPSSSKRPSLLRVPSFNNGAHWEPEVSLSLV